MKAKHLTVGFRELMCSIETTTPTHTGVLLLADAGPCVLCVVAGRPILMVTLSSRRPVVAGRDFLPALHARRTSLSRPVRR